MSPLTREGPARLRESEPVIRQAANSKTREQAESKIQRRDQRARDEATIGIGRDCEFGDDPCRAFDCAIVKTGSEIHNFFRREAVEEEVCGDQVVIAASGLPDPHIGSMGANAIETRPAP